MFEEQYIACPYCGECFLTAFDTSAGSQEYIEDCFVCCRPIVIEMQVASNGRLDQVTCRSEND